MNRFQNKFVLITGGTSGMGLAGARRIVAEGGQVLITGRHPERLTALREELPKDIDFLANDAARPLDAEALAVAVRALRPLDGVWLNAGYAALGTPESVTVEAFDQMMATNVRGPVLQLVQLSPLLKSGASIVLTSSSSTYEGAALTSLYAATKGALVALARSWAVALAPRGIRVNVLIPGPIDTNFRDFLSPEARTNFEQFIVGQVPLGRAGTAEEAAAVALFLLSSDSAYVTGSQYAVDGGLLLR
ncbi:SDR family oxidoreductase [Hymenobacter arcticus]